ncbi:Golgi transport complex subunit 6 [Lithohypha guttulata]|nr:Golgi transport complex subunit 6 [Lithohypha guttulata]
MGSTSTHYDLPATGFDATVDDNSLDRRGNALTNKLTRVLSSSYADTEIRDALRLFDARYGHKGGDDDLDLRYEAQREMIEANAQIVNDFSRVAEQLDRVGTLIASLNQTCNNIRKHVVAARQEVAPMLDEVSTLLSQKKETEQKQQLLDSFREHFLVSEEDLAVLTSSAEPVDGRFFELLARMNRINKDCELLLGYENQRMGLELMEQTTRDLNAAYKKLFNWTTKQFRSLDLEDPHISGSVRRSLRALSERPALFQNCLDSFAEARQATVAEAFQRALTDSIGAARAIEFSTHDPFRYLGDMLAWTHSATVSEMEALEGLFVSDAEELSRALQQGKAADPFAMSLDDGNAEQRPFDGRAALNALISRNMALVAHTLTQRISTAIRNLTDPVDIYKAYNVLSFYHDMFQKLIWYPTRAESNSRPRETDETDAENTLLTALTTLQSQAYTQFASAATDTLHSDIDEQPSTDLHPPTALKDSLNAFTAIAYTRGPSLTMPEFSKLYGTLLAPVLEACAALAEKCSEQPNSTESSTLIYKLNYMHQVQQALVTIATGSGPGKTKLELANQPLESAQDEIDSLSSNLIDVLADSFSRSSGLTALDSLIERSPSLNTTSAKKRYRFFLQPAHRTPEDSSNGDRGALLLEVLAQQLDNFLASALMDAQDSLSRLIDKALSADVLRDAVEIFRSRFEKTVGYLSDVDEGVEREQLARRMGGGRERIDGESEEDDSDEERGLEEEMPRIRDVYPRTIEEVRALLS